MGDNHVKVGIADLNLVLPPGTIMTIGLGSCVGIALYDKKHQIAGLSHIMLPDSTQFKNSNTPMKFADLAIPILVQKMVESGATAKELVAKIAGGASMFNFSEKSIVSDIGTRNVIAVKEALKKENIPILAEETGGNKGRTMIVDSSNGQVTIRIVGQNEMIL